MKSVHEIPKLNLKLRQWRNLELENVGLGKPYGGAIIPSVTAEAIGEGLSWSVKMYIYDDWWVYIRKVYGGKRVRNFWNWKK